MSTAVSPVAVPDSRMAREATDLIRSVESDLLSFESGHDFIEATKTFLERHDARGCWFAWLRGIREISARSTR